MPFPKIAAVATATPPHRFTQSQVLTLADYRDEERSGDGLRAGNVLAALQRPPGAAQATGGEPEAALRQRGPLQCLNAFRSC